MAVARKREVRCEANGAISDETSGTRSAPGAAHGLRDAICGREKADPGDREAAEVIHAVWLFAQFSGIVYNRRLPMDLAAIQSALRERNIDAWLFYDHHHRDPIAYRVLGLPAGLMVTRRWFYLVPAQGEPVNLLHKIEAGHLDSLPGSKRQY